MSLLDKYQTVAQLAEEMGVSVQRVHQLIELYSIPVEKPHSRLTLIAKRHGKKLSQMDRPSGVHRNS